MKENGAKSGAEGQECLHMEVVPGACEAGIVATATK